jgi:pentatricopeptide repeat protein
LDILGKYGEDKKLYEVYQQMQEDGIEPGNFPPSFFDIQILPPMEFL